MERLKKFPFKKLESGKSKDVKDFFKELIEPQFTQKEKIKELHKSLMNYVNLKEATFFVRLYGSFPKNKYDLLRRGFLTVYPDKSRMVFCDNTFSMLFTGLKLAGISINENELVKYFKQNKLICSFGVTSLEKELSYYTTQNAIRVNLNSKGWYLAHIKPTGYGYEKISEKKLSEFFPNLDRGEWDPITKTRKSSDNLDENQKKILKAHFIRLVHPLNSFLVPKRNHITYSGKNIGEEKELLEYVRDYLRTEFREEYEEFDKLSLEGNIQKYKTKIKNIEWFDIPKKSSNKKVNDNKNMKTSDFEENDAIYLDNRLKSIGKEVFVEILFPSISKNKNIAISEISNKYPLFSKKSLKSQISVLSSAKSIFKKGLESEALQIIYDSKGLKSEIRERAKKYIEEKNKN